MFERCFAHRAWRYGLALCGLLAAPWAYAGDVEITAVYRAADNRDDFVNTTPTTGFCAEFACDRDTVSVALPITYERRVQSGLPPVPQRWSLQVPGERQISLTSDRGDTVALKLHITHIAQTLNARNNDFQPHENPAGHYQAGGGCAFVHGEVDDGNAEAGFIWRVSNPVSPSLCYPATSGATQQNPITPYARSLSIGYRLILPKPHKMYAGTYRGSVTYTVGENGDFGLGSGVTALSTNSVTLDFVVKVHHELSIRFPANSDRVVLEPVEVSWEQWLRSGAETKNLQAQLPFRLTASGPFTVSSICGEIYADINYCLMRNQRTQERAAFKVKIQPPAGIEYEDMPGRVPIPRNLKRDEPLRLIPTTAVDNGLGRLIFIADQYWVRDVMLKTPGDDWSGYVTVVFDARL